MTATTVDTIAEYECLGDHVLLVRTAHDQFTVSGSWSNRKHELTIEHHQKLDLRQARIEFERLVSLSICRMTLDRLYPALDIERPIGPGKYGLFYDTTTLKTAE